MLAKVNLSPNSVTRRSLGAFEEFFYLLKQVGSPNILLVVEVEATINPARWRAAVEAVSQRYPLLRSVITRRPRRRPAFQVSGGTARQSSRVLPLENADLDKFCRNELQTSFKLTEKPWRQTLFLGDGRAVLALSIDHTISDGPGAVLLVQDLLKVLAGATLDGPMELSLSHDQMLGVVPNDLYLKETAQVFPQQGEGAQPPSKIEAELVIEHEMIDERAIQQITTAARNNGTTVHGALTAAILLAGARLHAPWAENPVHYLSPIDNRQFLNAEEHFGLMLTLGAGEFVSDGSDFWTLARRIRQEIVASLTPMRAAEFLRGMQSAMDPEMLPEDSFQLLPPCDLMVTNFGMLPIAADYSPLRIKAIMPYVTSIPHSQTVSAATIGGTLSLSNVSYAPIPNLLAEAKAILAAL